MPEQDIANSAACAVGSGILLIYFAIIILMIVALWKVFSKAGEPGWAAIVPIYNVIVLLKVAGKPWWWLLLMLIPLVNIVMFILTYIALANSFGKGGGFAAGLILLPIIFLPILAFDSSQYQGAAAA
ncbi:MAG: DUF5684 domain-containing protein [bacterium]